MKEITKDTMKQIKHLTEEQITENSFLTDFLNKLNMKELTDCLELKSVLIADFGRKTGYTHKHIHNDFFRFFIHLGSAELYYYDAGKDSKNIPLLDGYGFVISPKDASSVDVTVYPDSIRLINDGKIQKIIPKIRPAQYKRTLLILDFQYNLPESFYKMMNEGEVKNNEGEVSRSEHKVKNNEDKVSDNENKVKDSDNEDANQ